MELAKLDKWHRTRKGYLVFGLVELAIAYGFISWAINSAHLWAYLLAVLFFIGAVRNLALSARHLFHR